MKTLDIHTAAFLGLLRAGLWETEVRLGTPQADPAPDFSAIRRVAEEQSVTGVVAAVAKGA